MMIKLGDKLIMTEVVNIALDDGHARIEVRQYEYEPLFRTVRQHALFLQSGLTLEQWQKVKGESWRG